MITVRRNKWVFEEVEIPFNILLQLRKCGRECFPTTIGWIWSKVVDPEIGDCTLTLRAILSDKDYDRFLMFSDLDDKLHKKMSKYNFPCEVSLNIMPFKQEYVPSVGKHQYKEVLKVVMKGREASV